jgi:hypothetical protein
LIWVLAPDLSPTAVVGVDLPLVFYFVETGSPRLILCSVATDRIWFLSLRYTHRSQPELDFLCRDFVFSLAILLR